MTPINKEEARRHMELLGRDLEQTIWQTLPDRKTKKGFPSVSTDRNKLLSGVEGGGNAGFALAHTLAVWRRQRNRSALGWQG